MSTTNFGLNDAFAVKLWEKNLAVAMRDYLHIKDLMGESPNSVIQVKTNTSKGPGDQLTYGLRARLQGSGFTENQIAEGNGESLSIYSDKLTINELGHVVGVKSKNTIDQQRVPFDLREEARDGLTQWWGDRLSACFFNQVCGNTAITDVRYSGMTLPTAPTANRYVAEGAVANDQSLSSSNTFDLTLIDKAVELARIGDNQQIVNPIKVGGQDKYIVYLHPKQVTSLRTNTATGQWLDITKFALSSGTYTKDNPIYTGALGEYNSCILRRSQDIPYGVNSGTNAAITTVRRAVLLGSQACMMGYGQKGGRPNKFRWNEELFDHKRRLEVSAWCIFGMKKAVFNNEDFGTVVMSSYTGG
jgi:N4-gp56 family major capsid protein